MAKLQEVSKIIRKHYVEVKGELIEVRSTSSPEQYEKNTTVFENKLAKGAKAGTSEYWVKPEDFIPAKRASSTAVKSAMLADIKAGMSVEELATKYNIEVQ